MSIEGAAREGEKKARVNVHSRSSPFLVSIEFLPSAHTDPSLPPAAIPKLVRSLGFFLPSSLSLSLLQQYCRTVTHDHDDVVLDNDCDRQREREAGTPTDPAPSLLSPPAEAAVPSSFATAAAFLPPSRGNHEI